MSSTHAQTTDSSVGRRGRGAGERSMVAPGEPRSYYGEPILAKPVWHPMIPFYFWIGGMAGAAAPLGFLARVRGNDALARRAVLVALGGSVVSPVLLIWDLGKPSRFLNMLRVFKVTSPMSVGSWILSAYGTGAALAAATELLGLFPRLGRAGQAASLVLGPGLSTYTATLIANTAVPVWHEAHEELPPVFAASSAAAAGGLLAAVTPTEHAGAARRLAVLGSMAELGLVHRMEKRLGEDIGRHYREQDSGVLARGAKALTAAGGVLVAGGGRRRRLAIAGGSALTLGSLLERWAIFRAGIHSSRSAADTVGPQRARLAESGGRPSSYERVPAVAVEDPGAPRA